MLYDKILLYKLLIVENNVDCWYLFSHFNAFRITKLYNIYIFFNQAVFLEFYGGRCECDH